MKKLLLILSLGVSACTTLDSSSFSPTSFSSSYGMQSQPLTTERTFPNLPFPDEDLKWLYLTTYGEVRNQSDHEVEAVCQVIYNRLVSGIWGDSFKEVVLSHKQFSVWNKRGGQRRYLLRDDVVFDTDYSRIKSVCNSVLRERLKGVDTSLGINYFYHPNGMKPMCIKYKKFGKRKRTFKCTRWRKLPPKWAYHYEHKQRIGAGVFMRKSH